MADPKYERAREDGKKGYVVLIQDWGRKREQIIYALSAGDARAKARRGLSAGCYIISVQRKPFLSTVSDHTEGSTT